MEAVRCLGSDSGPAELGLISGGETGLGLVVVLLEACKANTFVGRIEWY